MTNNLPDGQYNLTIAIDAGNGFVFKNLTKDITYVSDVRSYYIITNKPVFKAGEISKITSSFEYS